MSLATPLARVRGLGSAGQGTQHWWWQRLTAVVLAPLSLWLIISLVNANAADHGAMLSWLRAPLNAALLL
ncbi:MAG: succinate dehydrogenase, hydrophobic membrane anchor protein, partial [Gammaproteobacteria bacterium]